MKILIVASKTKGFFSPFILEQSQFLSALGIELDFLGIGQKGVIGYLKSYRFLRKKIKEYQPDIIHAHYGLSGLVANLQKQVPVITTFHGSDIHTGGYLLILSKICMKLSRYNIFVGKRLYDIAKYKRDNYAIQPCGVNLEAFKYISKESARKALGWNDKAVYVLFAGAFTNYVKNSSLAQKVIEKIEDVTLVELEGYNRQEVNLLMNACDCLFMTSYREASPMVIKEAMLCGCPIVSTDVGDVRWVIGDTEGCFITSCSVDDCVEKVHQAIRYGREHGKTKGRQRIIDLQLDNRIVANRINNIYRQIINEEKH